MSCGALRQQETLDQLARRKWKDLAVEKRGSLYNIEGVEQPTCEVEGGISNTDDRSFFFKDAYETIAFYHI